jgi:hypothetical protein
VARCLPARPHAAVAGAAALVGPEAELLAVNGAIEQLAQGEARPAPARALRRARLREEPPPPRGQQSPALLEERAAPMLKLRSLAVRVARPPRSTSERAPL